MSRLALLFCICACVSSVPDLQKQAIHSNLELPTTTSGGLPLLLQDSEGTLELGGSLLIWNEDIAVTSLVHVAKASNAKRQQTVNYERVSHWAARERKKLAARATELETLGKELIALRSSAYQRAKELDPQTWAKHAAEQRQTGITLLRVEFDKLAALDSAWNRTATETVMRKYCEGKLFAYAVNYGFLRSQYHQRPTPSIICEDYYLTQGMFSDTNLCAANRGDYLQCLWQDGVLKSRYFVGNYATGTQGEKQAEQLTNLHERIAQHPAAFRELLLATHNEPSKSRHLRSYLRLGRIGFGDKTITVRPARNGAYVLKTVQDVESQMQSQEDSSSLPAAHRLFPQTPASAQAQAQRLRIVMLLQTLASKGRDISISDYKFNLPVTAYAHVNPATCTAKPSSAEEAFACNVKSMDELVPALQETPPILSADDAKQLSDILARSTDLEVAYQQHSDEVAKRDIEAFTAYSQSLKNAAQAVSAEGVALALFPRARLLIDKTATRYKISVKFLEKGEIWYTSCFDRERNEETVCIDLNVTEVQDNDVFYAYYDEEEGRLDLRFNLAQPEVLGFGFLSRDSSDRELDRTAFCDLQDTAFHNLTLAVALYTNKYDDTLEFVSGNGLFQSAAGETAYSASIGFERAIDI